MGLSPDTVRKLLYVMQHLGEEHFNPTFRETIEDLQDALRSDLKKAGEKTYG